MTDATLSDSPDKIRHPFRPGMVLALVLVAVFSLSALGALSAYAPEISNGDDGRGHALSRSAIGYGGLVKLLKGMGRPVLLSRGPLRGGVRDGLLILTPPLGREEEAFETLRWEAGSVLVVLPKWQVTQEIARKGWVREAGTLSAANALSVLPEDVRQGLVLSEDTAVTAPRLVGGGDRLIATGAPVRALRTLSGPGWTPVILDGAGRALVLTHDDTGLYVLSDPDLLNTQGMDEPAKARAALALLDTLGPSGQAVAFDLSLHGFTRPRSVLRLLLEPPLLGFTLCLLFAAALVGWQAMIRFQPHRHGRRAVALGKKALADNTAALVRLARREHRMAAPYAELIRAQAARAVAAPPSLSRDATTALLDRLAKRQGAETTFADLSAQADRARNAGDLMNVARSLIRWKLEMTRGRD
ncbi:hypothetical protein [Brevundimonas sp.]|uniref:hypothetical protein n=1 Tax=Brevundimonas sp. TaxID=1871086 RepID=UPI002737B970|nr:hypothetical protein [Brevundimonas sp.]MDP3802389.1 hypothetical protein [Brevundimonas sp.]